MKQEYDFSEGVRGRFFREDNKSGYPGSDEKPDWAGPEGRLGKLIIRETKKSLKAYREQPRLISEHERSEQGTAHGGYARRQLFELVQNSADALLDSPGKSILVRLTERFLYCADNGNPIDEDGIEGLMFDRMSSKRNTTVIGRFGRGFKSVLGVTDAPEFYSRSVSFRFDRGRAAERIAEVSPSECYPVLRLPEPIEPDDARRTDEELRELMSWATNIVRLPLKEGVHGDLARQIRDFPPEFLLFVDHVRYLTLDDEKSVRDLMLHHRDGELFLEADRETRRWRCFDATHCLSEEARSDWHLGDDNDARIRWAVPLDQLTQAGRFWAFFPTSTSSLVAGILNAPWKTNEDRQSLLPGPYNEELIRAAAEMIAEVLPELATDADPARHLDALPRRKEQGDTEQSDLLRAHLLCQLREREIVPDQDGKLHRIEEISYPPKGLTVTDDASGPLERWAAYPGRPSNWLHHCALTRNRLAGIDRLFSSERGEPRYRPPVGEPSAPRAAVADWLQALVDDKEGDEAIRASMTAIQTAAAIPAIVRAREAVGAIVLTATRDWCPPDSERLFLPDETRPESISSDTESHVHPDLVSDRDTLSALRDMKFGSLSPRPRIDI